MFNNIPPVTKNFLLINVTLYIVSMVLLNSDINLFDLLSTNYLTSVFFEPYQVITHMFMHSSAGIGHIFFNMFALVIFGSYLEKVWGAKRFFIIYFAAGLGAFLLYNGIGVYQMFQLKNEIIALNILDGTQFQSIDEFEALLVNNEKNGQIFVPEMLPSALAELQYFHRSSMLGASGAIFGLLAAFGILFPNTELYLLFIPFPIKAKYLIGGYIAFEIFNSFQYGTGGSVAHLAHVGGAIVGAAYVLYSRKKDRNNFY